MQAVILAGGLGKRLRPITETVPKPLVPVNGKPVVAYTLEHLPAEIREVVFVVGYKGDMMRSAFGAEYGGRAIRYVEQGEPQGTGHAVKKAAPLIRGKFLLLYGDDIYGPEGMRRLVRHDWALLVRRVEHPERFGVVVLGEDGSVTRIVEKPQKFLSDLSWVGACVAHPEILSVEVPRSERGEYEFPDMVNVLLRREMKFQTELADLWLPGNTKEEVAAAARELQGERGKHSGTLGGLLGGPLS